MKSFQLIFPALHLGLAVKRFSHVMPINLGLVSYRVVLSFALSPAKILIASVLMFLCRGKKFAKPQDNLPNSQGVSLEVATCNNSKRNKHVLRLTLSMPVLYDRLKKAIELQTGPTSHTIGLDTLNMAIAMVESLEIYKGMSRMVSIRYDLFVGSLYNF